MRISLKTKRLFLTFGVISIMFGAWGQTWPVDSIYPEVKRLRISFHVFSDSSGGGNFNSDILAEAAFLQKMADWVNHKLSHLDPMDPPFSSAYVSDARVRIHLDTVYFHRDQRAWDASEEIDAWYMRDQFIDFDTVKSYRQKHQTLPVFFAGNHPVVGGFTSNLGDKLFVAMRGCYARYLMLPEDEALEECAKNLLHELGHSMGLAHNFQGGAYGDQCDTCEDNGCPLEGTSNNIMDYWPGYGHALSVCQLEIIHEHLEGKRGNISEVLINDSCYVKPGWMHEILPGEVLLITGTRYLHGDLLIRSGGELRVEGYLSVPGDCGIYLEPGATLIVGGGTLGNLCGDLWLGIRQISGPAGFREAPKIQLEGGTLENARIGIESHGEIVFDFSGFSFKNNIVALDLDGYPSDTLLLTACRFITTGRLNHYDEGVYPQTFARLRRARMAILDSCEFINQPGTLVFSPDYLGNGWMQFSGGLAVRKSTFLNLNAGFIYSTTHHQGFVDCRENLFINNLKAVALDGSMPVNITNNHFELQRYDRQTTLGIMAFRAGRIIIANNHFYSQFGAGEQAGIWIKDPEPFTSPFFSNYFENLPAGILVTGTPDLDSLILMAEPEVLGGQRDAMLGPQLRDNRFIKTAIKAGFANKAGFGLALGTPETTDFPLQSSSGWPLGGAMLYQKAIPFSGFLIDTAEVSGADNGWVMQNSLLSLSDPVLDPALPGNEILESALSNQMRGLLKWEDSLIPLKNSRDPFLCIAYAREDPNLARSSKWLDLWDSFMLERETWIREELSRLAQIRTERDRQLTLLANHYAIQNAREWMRAMSVLPVIPIDEPADSIMEELTLKLRSLQIPAFVRFAIPFSLNTPPPAFSLHPNPTRDLLRIHPEPGYKVSPGWEIRIYTIQGFLVLNRDIYNAGELELDIKHLSAGPYLMHITGSQGPLGSLLFIVIK